MTKKYIVESFTILSRIEGIPGCLMPPGLRPTQTMIRNTNRSVVVYFFNHERTAGQRLYYKIVRNGDKNLLYRKREKTT